MLMPGSFPGVEEESIMKIAISTDEGSVSAHFGRCPSFTIVDINDGKVISKEEINNPGHQPGYIPEFLSKMGVNSIVAGGMGMRALELFKSSNIKTIMGISGSIDDVVSQLLSGALEGGASTCNPGDGKGYGVDKTVCEHED